ncbi:MAG: hypothetical protein WA510_26970 [Acidobacteriaceae bacterium]
MAGLDLSIQGQITNLLLDVQTAKGLSYLYISHNLELVARIADEVAVIHEGRVVEQAKVSEMFARGRHSYGQAPCPTVLKGRLAHRAYTGA